MARVQLAPGAFPGRATDSSGTKTPTEKFNEALSLERSAWKVFMLALSNWSIGGRDQLSALALVTCGLAWIDWRSNGRRSPTESVGENTIAEAVARLERGADADLHPVFGELFSITVWVTVLAVPIVFHSRSA
jgi:hypothetical protein